jgi:hypothetical protein
MKFTDTTYDRRTVLTASAATIAALAGCSDSDAPTGGGTSTASKGDSKNVIGEFGNDGWALTIGINNAEAADVLQQKNPDGQIVSETEIEDTASQVSLSLEGYTVGTHEFLAVNKGGNATIVDSKTHELRPEFTVTRVDAAADIKESVKQKYVDSIAWGSNASVYCWIENTGTAPGVITSMNLESEHITEEDEIGLQRYGNREIPPGETGVAISPERQLGEYYIDPLQGPITITLSSKRADDIVLERTIHYDKNSDATIRK